MNKQRERESQIIFFSHLLLWSLCAFFFVSDIVSMISTFDIILNKQDPIRLWWWRRPPVLTTLDDSRDHNVYVSSQCLYVSNILKMSTNFFSYFWLTHTHIPINLCGMTHTSLLYSKEFTFQLLLFFFISGKN